MIVPVPSDRPYLFRYFRLGVRPVPSVLQPIASMLAVSDSLALCTFTDSDTGTCVRKCDILSHEGCSIEFISPKRTAGGPACRCLSCLRQVQTFCCLDGSFGKCTVNISRRCPSESDEMMPSARPCPRSGGKEDTIVRERHVGED